MRYPFEHRLGLALALMLLLSAALTPITLGQGATPTPEQGYYYVVVAGDTWNRVSRATGIPIAVLKENNPEAIHPRDWLIEGERLFIPPTSVAVPATPSGQEGVWYQVKRGDTWRTVALATGVSVADLWEANPARLDASLWLYTGQWLWIPGGEAAAAATAIPTAMRGRYMPNENTRIMLLAKPDSDDGQNLKYSRARLTERNR